MARFKINDVEIGLTRGTIKNPVRMYIDRDSDDGAQGVSFDMTPDQLQTLIQGMQAFLNSKSYIVKVMHLRRRNANVIRR